MILFRHFDHIYLLWWVEFLVCGFEVGIVPAQYEMGLLRGNFLDLLKDSLLRVEFLLLDGLHWHLLLTQYDMRLSKLDNSVLQLLLSR